MARAVEHLLFSSRPDSDGTNPLERVPSMLKTPIGRLRFVGLLEGASSLALFGFAMPLKYLTDWVDEATMEQIMFPIGLTHGLLFVLYNLVLFHTWLNKEISFKWSVVATIASILPIGTIVFDHKVKSLSKPA